MVIVLYASRDRRISIVNFAMPLFIQTGKQKKRKYEKVIAAINMTLDGFCDHTSG